MDTLLVLPCSCICLNSSCPVKLVDVNTLLSAGHESSDFTGSFIFPSCWVIFSCCACASCVTSAQVIAQLWYQLSWHHICINKGNSDLANGYFAVILLAEWNVTYESRCHFESILRIVSLKLLSWKWHLVFSFFLHVSCRIRNKEITFNFIKKIYCFLWHLLIACN